MLAVTNAPLCLRSFQEDLIHDLAGHRDETDWPVVPQVFLFPLFENGGYVYPFPISGNFTRLPQFLQI